MSYVALYRKFRPGGFDEVAGQEHIVTTLKNQIVNNRLGHAYLFCGTRGTGKTSIAKIFAKAVNCEHHINGNPCHECGTCKSIQNNTSMNVIEIDAASNNGVDNIRQIREEVQYSPTEGRYKVYIIDEVHMLSIGAFNALLKTLEEPPSYVIFILATTEVHKIPVTILSRCQRYDFRRITVDTISKRLRELVDQENIHVQEKALRYIAKTADGSMRDALSLLEQSAAFYMDQELTYDNVLDVLGAVDTEVFSRFLKHIIEKDTLSCIKELEELIMQGRELSQFVMDFTWFLRNMLLVKSSESVNEELLDMSEERLDTLKKEAGSVTLESLMRYIRIFSELSNQLKYAAQKRVLLEIAFIKLTVPQMENNIDSVFERLSALEKQIAEGTVVQRDVPREEKKALEKKEKPQLPKAGIDDVMEVVRHWPKIESCFEGGLRTILRKTQLSAKAENILLLVFSDVIEFEYVSKKIEELREIIQKEIGKVIEIQTKLLEKDQSFEDIYAEIKSKINISIEIEDLEEEDL